jgi:hypothetical protein
MLRSNGSPLSEIATQLPGRLWYRHLESPDFEPIPDLRNLAGAVSILASVEGLHHEIMIADKSAAASLLAAHQAVTTPVDGFFSAEDQITFTEAVLNDEYRRLAPGKAKLVGGLAVFKDASDYHGGWFVSDNIRHETHNTAMNIVRGCMIGGAGNNEKLQKVVPPTLRTIIAFGLPEAAQFREELGLVPDNVIPLRQPSDAEVTVRYDNADIAATS